MRFTRSCWWCSFLETNRPLTSVQDIATSCGWKSFPVTDNARNQNLIWEIRANEEQFYWRESDIQLCCSPTLGFIFVKWIYFYLKISPSVLLRKCCQRERCAGQWSRLKITTEGRHIHPRIKCTDPGFGWWFRMNGPAALISDPIPAPRSPLFPPCSPLHRPSHLHCACEAEAAPNHGKCRRVLSSVEAAAEMEDTHDLWMHLLTLRSVASN